MTLIEAVLYIAISLALIVGGLAFYQQASLQSRTSSVVRTYAALITEARIVAGEAGYVLAANFEEILYARGSIPAENWDATKPAGQRLRLPFANMYASLSVVLAVDGRTDITLFQHNMPVGLCSRLLVTSRASTNYANGAANVFLQDEDYSGTLGLHNYSISPTLAPSQAATYCRTADSNGNGLVYTQMTFRTFD